MCTILVSGVFRAVMKKSKIFSLNSVSMVIILTLIAFALNILEFPLWFAPNYYKIDFSSVAALIGSYFVGPLAGIIIAVLRTILKALIFGSTTAIVGEYVDVIITILFVFPAAIIYRNNKTNKTALIGMGVGVLFMTVIGCILNYFLLIPIYSCLAGIPESTIIADARLHSPGVTDLESFIFLITIPYNILKGVACSVVSFLVILLVPKIKKLFLSSKRFGSR